MGVLDIPYRGDTWSVYVRLYGRTGEWAESFVKLYLRGDLTRIPPKMVEDAKAYRAKYLEWKKRQVP